MSSTKERIVWENLGSISRWNNSWPDFIYTPSPGSLRVNTQKKNVRSMSIFYKLECYEFYNVIVNSFYTVFNVEKEL